MNALTVAFMKKHADNIKPSETMLIDGDTLARQLGTTHPYVKHMTRKRLIPVYKLGYRIQRYNLAEVQAAILKLRRPARGERLSGGAS